MIKELLEIIPSNSNDTKGIVIDGEWLNQIKKRYNGSEILTDSEWDNVADTTYQIFSNCPPTNNGLITNTGLILGKVQSGKTLSFTSLIALAFDNEYQVAIVLAGTKNALMNQTYQRLIEDFELTSNYGVLHLCNPGNRDFESINNYIRLNRKVLIVVLKHVSRLDHLTELFRHSELRDIPTIIIDDEGDQASLNTQFRANEQSATYRRILDLRNVLRLHSYLAYTATPQANLLISGIDELSPDFSVLVSPGPEYCGGNEFFGDNCSRYLREINSITNSNRLTTIITQELKHSLMAFLVGGVIRSLRHDLHNHSMLIHTSSKRSDHISIEGKVKQILENWQSILTLRNDDPSKQDLLINFYNAYDDLAQTVSQIPTWETIVDNLQPEILTTEIWLVNSLPEGRNPSITPFRMKNNILIGGNMLERGVTVQGLAITYITREAKSETNADTLEQRARWFGYKREYIDICRIFLTRRLIGRYKSLLRHEDDFWAALERNQIQGIPIREWPRFFQLDANRWRLRPTRTSVANFYQFRGTGWHIQGTAPTECSASINNIKVIEDLVNFPNIIKKKYGNIEHLLMSSIPTEKVISSILSRINMDERIWPMSYFEEYLSRLYYSQKLLNMDVLIMNNGISRIRRIYKDRRFELMQGKSVNKNVSDPDYYPGDRFINNNKVQLQIHRIHPRDENYDFLALALFIPKNLEYDLQLIVRG